MKRSTGNKLAATLAAGGLVVALLYYGAMLRGGDRTFAEAAAVGKTVSASGAEGPWPQWRGPRRDGISTEKGLLATWEGHEPPLVWRIKGLGKGFATVAISGGRIYTMGSRGDQEFLCALSVKDGAEIWSAPVGKADHSNCTPTVDGDKVYAVGLSGDLVCVRAENGQEVWRKNFAKDFGGKMMSGWGFSESPLVDGDVLVCTPGGKDAILAGLDKRTGEVRWKTSLPKEIGTHGLDGAAYASIVVSEGGGVRQYVQLVGKGLIGVAARDGKFLWAYNRIANETANIPTPIVRGEYVFCSTGYGTGAALLKLQPDGQGGVTAEEVYLLSAKELQNHHGGMILLGDHIYCGHGHNQGFPMCIDLLTGKPTWKQQRGPGTGSAAVTCADGHLYFRYQNAVMALVEANPEKFVLKGTFKIAAHNGESWPHPVIADGRIYLRDQDELLSYDVKQR